MNSFPRACCWTLLGSILAWHGLRLASPAGEPVTPQEESPELRYATAQWRLAEANLKRMLRMNEKVPNSVSANVVDVYQGEVDMARQRVEMLKQGRETDSFQAWLRRAEAGHKSAEALYRSILAANQRMAGTVDGLDVERLRLRVELAKAALERGRALSDKPAESRLAWQVDMLQDEVQRLQEELLRNTPATRIVPWWR